MLSIKIGEQKGTHVRLPHPYWTVYSGYAFCVFRLLVAGPAVTDYVLPFALAAAIAICAGTGEWAGSIATLIS